METNFRFRSKNLKSERFDDDGVLTKTSHEQVKVEASICSKFLTLDRCIHIQPLKLNRNDHSNFLWKGLQSLPKSWLVLDASRPWLCYWILHSLELLNEPIPEDTALHVVNFLGRCQSTSGGFAGGPGQLSHLAPTYAAVMALCILGTEEAYNLINRSTMYQFLLRVRSESGAFRMHEGGEVDIRGVYCAVTVATILGLITSQLFDLTPQWLCSCQTYEGGFAGYPGLEAHGGYSFCGFAALVLLGKNKFCDIKSLLRWTVNKQMRYEGGFQGRTNKLVDGCYSFWQGGAIPLIHLALSYQDDNNLGAERWMFDMKALQEYILVCCQHYEGGLIDKPGRSRDFYHTCYCLSGLSISQHFGDGQMDQSYIVGHSANELRLNHALFNITPEAVIKASQFFSEHPYHLPTQDK